MWVGIYGYRVDSKKSWNMGGSFKRGLGGLIQGRFRADNKSKALYGSKLQNVGMCALGRSMLVFHLL